MKLVISKDLKKRIRFAALNGSKVAKRIYDVINVDRNLELEDVMLGKSNFFDSVRVMGRGGDYDTISIKITYCARDVNNDRFPEKDNPDAGYDQHNRSSLTPVKFARMFRCIEDSTDLITHDFDYFDDIIRIGSKVNFSMSGNPLDFFRAYCKEYYSSLCDGDSTLWNSCMRYEDKARVASDFYTHFCGCKIIRAYNDEGETLARAVVWPRVCIDGNDEPVCLIERIYTSFWSVRELMLDFAVANGVQVRKTVDSYCDKNKFTILTDCTLGNKGSEVNGLAYILVPQVKWHHGGAPYLDTFTYVYKPYSHNSFLYMTNTSGLSFVADESVFKVAEFDTVSGHADRTAYTCPVCGKKSRSSSGASALCTECNIELITESQYGSIIKGGVRNFDGDYWPEKCFDGNNPTNAFTMYKNINRLF